MEPRGSSARSCCGSAPAIPDLARHASVRRQPGRRGARPTSIRICALAYPGARVERFEPDALDGAGLVFAALPHGHSQAIAPEIIARGIPFVDLGADFRLERCRQL